MTDPAAEIPAHIHHVPLDGAHNVRDVGGATTVDGHIVGYGLAFRADSLAALSDADLDVLAGLRITTVADFRNDEEVAHAGADRLPAGCEWLHVPLVDPSTQLLAETLMTAFATDDMGAVEVALGGGRAEEFGAAGFFTRLEDPRTLAAFADVLGRIATTAPTGDAVLYHCMAGKDRTGAMTALLLGILGVGDEVIVADYLASNRFNAARNLALRERLGRRGMRPELIDPLLVQTPGQIRPLLDRVRADGGWTVFAEQRLGLAPDTITALRTAFLADGGVSQ